MQEESSGYERVVEGILDVSVIVPSCFENPLKEESVNFIHDVLLGTRTALLPVSAIIGSYHILTRYLRVSKVLAKNVLVELLSTRSRALYPLITTDLASLSLDYALAHNVESWDGYLFALAKRFDAKKIFSLDEELGKNLGSEDVIVQSPFKADKVRQYHRFLEAKKKLAK